MASQPVSVNDHTMIVVKTHADLNLQGWDQLEVRPVADAGGGFSITQDQDLVRVQCSSDLDLTIPVGADVTIERVSGDANLRNLSGQIQIQRVGGDLIIQNVDSAEILSVGGDCAILKSTGDLSIQRIGSDFSGTELHGIVHVEGVGGDANLKVKGGDIQVRAGGDIRVGIEEVTSQVIRLDAGGDVSLALPRDASVALDMRSRGHNIEIDYGGKSERIEKRLASVTFGEGSCKINIDAGGDIQISGDHSEVEGLDDLGDEIEEHWHDLEESREERSTEADEAFAFRANEFSDRINRRVEDAMRQADSRIQEAMKRLEQRTRRMERKGYGAIPPIPPIPPTPHHAGHWTGHPEQAEEKKRGASEEERTLILKMLQDKKITAEEAEKLLEALEG